MRPGPGRRSRTRGHTSNQLTTITTPKPTGKPPEPETPNTGGHIRQRTPAPWATRGACATHPDPDLWHPNETKLADHLNPQIIKATRICDTCPVKIQCLHWALENREPDGIYGGMTPRQRGQITRSAQRWRERKDQRVNQGDA